MCSISLITAALALSVFLLACRETPTDYIVVSKDEERMLKMAEDESGVKISEITYAETEFSDAAESADGLIRIRIDAKITSPNADTLPLYQVTSQGFDAGLVKSLFAFIFSGQKVSIPQGDVILTKADISDRINGITDQIQNGTWYKSTDYTEEQTQQILDNLMVAYHSAADETPPGSGVADGRMELVDADGIVPYCFLGAFGQYGFLQVVSYIGSDSDFGSMLNYSETNGAYAAPVAKVTGGADCAAYDSKMPVTLDDALALCQDLFDSLGMGNQTQFATAYIVPATGSVISDAPDGAGDEYAYKLYYRRAVRGVPVMFVEKLTGIGNYSGNWHYEMIWLIVGKRGIQGVRWESPLSIEDQVSDNAGMIGFEKAYEIFKRMVVTIYDAKAKSYVVDRAVDEYDIDIDRVSLEYVRIRKQDCNHREGYLIPAWVFYGNVNRTTSYYEGNATYRETGRSVSTEPVLVINAITGGIIDLQEGY